MKRIIVLTLILQLVTASGFGQTSRNRYEVEMLDNPNAGKKDTREVNAVLMFEEGGIKIQSRRSAKVFKEFKYSDIKSAEHSYSKRPAFQSRTAMAFALLSGMAPLLLLAREKEKHWLMVATGEDYAVLKIENDNYRLIRMEFIVKKVDVVDVDENR